MVGVKFFPPLAVVNEAVNASFLQEPAQFRLQILGVFAWKKTDWVTGRVFNFSIEHEFELAKSLLCCLEF